MKSTFNKRAAAIHAFDIFCTPRRGRLSPTQKEYLKPYKDKELSLEGNTLQTYFWEGTGHTVLLIHGWESNAHRWWKLIPELQARNYRIVTFDAPAHGASGGDRFSAILYAKAIYEVAMHYKPDYQVAHSVGALSSLLYFRDKKPKNLKKLVILGAPSELEEIMQDYQNILGLRQAIMNELNLLLQEQYPFSFKTFSGAYVTQGGKDWNAISEQEGSGLGGNASVS